MSVQEGYGVANRLLHRFAFRAGFVQESLADIENVVFRRTIRSIPVEDPVFITALPRSGTTILLEILVETGVFASHTYEDMPFVLCPMIWSRFSRWFSVDVPPRERDHGDGLQIWNRSPEAFEEMVWKRFWPRHYGADRIRPWAPTERDGIFESFLETHMRKVIAVRQRGARARVWYISKNNLNIARLAALPAPLRRGTILVPFRDPVQHAASMLHQHQRFLQLHEEDPFAREYMEAIGHHEFGVALRPVDFGGWLDEAPDPETLEFWLRYWLATYRFVLDHLGPPVHLVSYAHLTGQPAKALADLADLLDRAGVDLRSSAARLHPPRRHETETDGVEPSILRQASDLYDQLERSASIGSE